MLNFVLRVVRFSGKYSGKLKLSFVLSFIEGILQCIPIILIWQVIDRALKSTLDRTDIWMFTSILVVSAIIRMFLRYWFVFLESGAGYEICERERISLGDKLRRFPMRFFSQGNLGYVTSVITVDLPFIEEMGMDALDKVIGAYTTTLIGIFMLFAVDYRIALISVATFGLAALCFKTVETVARKQSPERQRQQGELVNSILEYVQGISVIKSFNMSGEKAGRIKNSIEATRKHSVDFEVALLKPTLFYKLCFAIGTAGTIITTAILSVNGDIEISLALAMFIFIFILYVPASTLSSLNTQLRIMEAGLDRFENLYQMEEMDEGSMNKPITNHSIVFENVGFSYEKEKVLDGINFETGEKTVTALVGPSGGGKTTIANLIVRFWDAQSGVIKIGGTDIREMSSDMLLSNISMVFQNVHLFNDTIENNIRFGCPNTSHEEIIATRQKAKCHDFIMNLPKNYNTVIGENGSLLSGGERQRISIARAILKDAPIIILDEATASVDPDNEMDIQQAIGALIHDKTLIMIAHRLSTIQSADQILVIDNKHIVESGTHEELLNKQGLYANLWNKRKKAGGWKINSANGLKSHTL